MDGFQPQAQEGANAGSTLAPDNEIAFVDAPDSALWVGFGAFATIFLLVLMLIIRGRVIKPARNKNKDTDFFEPAGDDAEITFEDPHDLERKAGKQKRKWFGGRKKDKKKSQHIEPEFDDNEAGRDYWTDENADDGQQEPRFEADHEQDQGIEPHHSPEENSRRKRFANLFSKKEQPTPSASHQDDSHHIDENGSADVEIYHDENGSELAPQPAFDDAHLEQQAEDDARQLAAEQSRAEELARAEERARLEHQAQAEAERRRADEAERIAASERERADAGLEARVTSLDERERALEMHSDDLRREQLAMNEKLDASLEARFAALSTRLDDRLKTVSSANDDSPKFIANNKEAEAAPGAYDGFQRIEAMIGALSDRLDKFERSDEGAAGLARQIALLNQALSSQASLATASRLQLNELVRAVLPVDRYQFRKKLSNGRVGDCAIAPAIGQTPFIINAQFPIEAFDHYARARAEGAGALQAANDYRRALLRHIVDVAENFIIPGETAEAAILFMPSDVVFNNLYSEFLDVVQDAARGRVWIVSPTSLMAIFHMMTAISGAATDTSKAAPMRDEEENRALINEIRTLRQRVSALENDPAHDFSGAAMSEGNPFLAPLDNSDTPDPMRPYPSDLAGSSLNIPEFAPVESSLSAEEAAFERLEREEAQAEAEGASATPRTRPPFPLR